MKVQKLAGTFIASLFLLNYPILSFFENQASIFQIPLLYFYLFSIWFLIIVVAYLIVRTNNKKQK